MRPGTLVGIKPEWRDPGETDDTHYIVIEDNGDRYLIMFVDKDNKFAFPLYSTVPAQSVYPIEETAQPTVEEPRDAIATEAPSSAITPPHLR